MALVAAPTVAEPPHNDPAWLCVQGRVLARPPAPVVLAPKVQAWAALLGVRGDRPCVEPSVVPSRVARVSGLQQGGWWGVGGLVPVPTRAHLPDATHNGARQAVLQAFLVIQ